MIRRLFYMYFKKNTLILYVLILSLIYFSDENEGKKDPASAEDTSDDNQDGVSGEVQYLCTKTNEVKFVKPNMFLFVPVSVSWKERKCEELDILICNGKRSKAATYGEWCDNKRVPSSLHHIVGDGNCLFRAVSYVVSGSQEYHAKLRRLTIAKMQDMGTKFKKITGQNVTKYVQETKMNQLGVWGTDVEIFALSALLKTYIFVFLSNERTISWIPYYSSLDQNSFSENECIYLQNKNCHFEVVLEM